MHSACPTDLILLNLIIIIIIISWRLKIMKYLIVFN
jgi:hypothetical protein